MSYLKKTKEGNFPSHVIVYFSYDTKKRRPIGCSLFFSTFWKYSHFFLNHKLHVIAFSLSATLGAFTQRGDCMCIVSEWVICTFSIQSTAKHANIWTFFFHNINFYGEKLMGTRFFLKFKFKLFLKFHLTPLIARKY